MVPRYTHKDMGAIWSEERRYQTWLDVELAATATVHLGIPPAEAISDLDAALRTLQVTPVPAGVDLRALVHDAWHSDPEAISASVEAGQAHVESWTTAEQVLNAAALEADYHAIRTAVVTKGRSLFRFLDSNYRAQVALLRSYLKTPLPAAQAERLAIVDQAIAAQAAKARFTAAADLGAAFGSAWKGERSDWAQLETIHAWWASHAALPPIVWSRLAALEDLATIEASRAELEKLLPALKAALQSVIGQLNLDVARALRSAALPDAALHRMASRLEGWEGDLEGLSAYVAFASRARLLGEAGAAALVDGLLDGALDHQMLVPAFDRAYSEVLRLALFSAWPELRSFDGHVQNNMISLFRQLDKARIGLAQEQIVAAHAAGRPSGGPRHHRAGPGADRVAPPALVRLAF